MIIIIPIFMYALFLDDLLRYAADVTEAVTSTPWDFTGQDYMKGEEKSSGVQGMARLMFCDHESSGDSYNQGQDCDATDHHDERAFVGHVCWLNDEGKAEQVTCKQVDTSVGNLGVGVYDQYRQQFGPQGGLYSCYAKAVVENYLLPKSFLQEFSNVDLSKENWKGKGDIHGNAKAGTDDTAYFLAQQDFAIVTDTLALNDKTASVKVSPDQKSGEMYDRVAKVYTGNQGFRLAQVEYQTFRRQLDAANILLPGVGDDALTPNVALPEAGEYTQKIENDQGGSNDFFATPWRDGAGDRHQKTANARGNYYMGCQNPESC
ncbi:hypothetical protein [Stigmatella aurantiaca]|nr:hypothetical protein [Stigmatella aurantiaca]